MDGAFHHYLAQLLAGFAELEVEVGNFAGFYRDILLGS